MRMTLSNAYLSANLDILHQLGYPRARALDDMGLDEKSLFAPHDRVPVDLYLSCIIAAAEHTSIRQIGLHLGLKFRVGGFGDTGAIYSYCEDLEEVMEMNNLYQRVAIDVGQVGYMRAADGGHYMCFQPYYADLKRYKFITDIIMGSYVTTYRWLSWGFGEDVASVSLPYVQPSEYAEYVDLLQTHVDLSNDQICVEFSDIAMTQKLTTRNPERLARARLALDRLIGHQTAVDDFAKGLDAAIRGAIEDGQVSAQIIASRMGLSVSGFRARLAETGEGIRPKIDRVRKAIFIEKHKAGLSLSQIALALAYNDQAAMNRAFRRWFDMTPKQWLLEYGASNEET